MEKVAKMYFMDRGHLLMKTYSTTPHSYFLGRCVQVVQRIDYNEKVKKVMEKVMGYDLPLF